SLHAQTISVDKTTLSVSALAGGPKVTQQVTVNSSGNAASFTTFVNTSWLSVNPVSGTAPSALNITADPTGLPATTTLSQRPVTLLGTPNNATVKVTLLVTIVAASPSSLQFSYQMGAPSPVAQPINLTGQATSFTAAVTTKQGGTWLTVTPSGSVPGT